MADDLAERVVAAVDHAAVSYLPHLVHRAATVAALRVLGEALAPGVAMTPSDLLTLADEIEAHR